MIQHEVNFRDQTAGIQRVIHTFYYYEDPWLASGLDVQLILLHHYPHVARLIDKQHKSAQRQCQCSKDPDANLYRTEGKLGVPPIVWVVRFEHCARKNWPWVSQCDTARRHESWTAAAAGATASSVDANCEADAQFNSSLF